MNALERKVLELIGENIDSPDVFTDDDAGMAPIRDSINDCIQEIVMLTGGNKRRYFIPLRTDQMFYRLRLANGEMGWITDVFLVNQMRRLDQTDLIKLSSEDPRWMISTGNPWSYLQIGKEIVGFHPKPSGSSDVVEIHLVEIPAAYTNDQDRVKIRKSFQHAVVSYAVGEYWASRGDAMEALKHMNQYFEVLGMKRAYDPQSERRPYLDTQKDRA
jgi:hypothetical protein